MSLELWMTQPHYERPDNLRGKEYVHEGYTEIECKVCKRMFPIAISRLPDVTTCGHPACGKDKVHV